MAYILRSVHVDSRDRINSGDSSSNFMVSLVQGFGRAKKIQLQSAEIPVSYYVINSSNNSFSLTEDANPPVTVTLPLGSPSATDLATFLQTALNSVSPGPLTYSVTFDSSTNKFTISNAPATNFSLTFTSNSPYVQLGFNVGTTSTGTSLTSTNVINLSGTNFFMIQLTNIPQTNTTSKKTSYTFKVPITVAPFSTEIYTNNGQWNQIVDYGNSSPVDINMLAVKLVDYNNNVINLNGNDWSFTLTIFL